MTGLEIIILIAGIVFVIISFFPGRKETAVPENADIDKTILRIKEAAAFQETELKRRVQEILEEQSHEVLSETKEKLSRMSNDKIIAVDEFSSQVLEKIENNNQEVIFLYDMFQKKEEEMKSAMNKLEQVRRENKELLDRLEEAEKSRGLVEAAGKKESQKAEIPADFVYHTQADGLAGDMEDTGAEESREDFCQQDEMTPEEIKRREQVLALYHENKNMKEISKQLSMGQGEVRLIIDLYGK